MRALIHEPAPLPTPQPEPPDCPQFVLRCDRCGAVASWLVPHKLFQPLVRELAERVGWVGIRQDETICPECRAKAQERKLPARAYFATRRCRSAWYGPALLDRMAQMQREGVSTRAIAAMVSAECHRDVSAGTVAQVLRYHRKRAVAERKAAAA